MAFVPVPIKFPARRGTPHSSVSKIPSLSSSRSQLSLTPSPSLSGLPEASASQGSKITLSRVTDSTSLVGLPPKSVTSAVTVIVPLLRLEISASVAVQTPPLTVAVVVIVFVPSEKVTVTICPSSTSVVVPDIETVPTSALSITPSPSIGVSIVIVGAVLSPFNVIIKLALSELTPSVNTYAKFSVSVSPVNKPATAGLLVSGVYVYDPSGLT